MKYATPMVILLISTALGIAGCAPVTTSSGEEFLTSIENLAEVNLLPGEMLRVVVTTSILGDVVANVAGDHVDLRILIPSSTDPHSYQPTPRDLTIIADAHIVFINGLGLETFLLDTLTNTDGRSVVISLSEGVRARSFTSSSDELESDRGDEHTGVDAHVWLDPENVATWINNTKDSLAALDPANAELYSSLADEYRASLNDLHAWIIDRIEQVPEADRKLVADHLALGYFADRYGFDIVGAVNPAFSTAAGVSAQELAGLQQAIQTSGAEAIFVAAGSNPIIAERLAADLGLQLVQLYIGTLSEPGGPAASYLDLMHYNVDAIVDALRH